MYRTKTTPALLLSVSLFAAGTAGAATIGDTDVKYSGYIKADAASSYYSDGTLASGTLGRDFYIPSLTPVGGSSEGAQFDSNLRQSRFRFATTTAVSETEKITGVLEFDFLVSTGGNERISNSYEPRLRHAYIGYKNFLIGQTWTTFMDTSALPESMDFIGNTDGITFARQAMVRYTSGPWQFAVENPESTITPFGGGGRIVADDNATPDLVAAYTHKADWGYVKVAGLIRQLSFDNGADIKSTESSVGISVTGKFKVAGEDDIRVSLITGKGLGRYAALNAANGGVLNENGNIEAIDSIGYAIAYRHVWTDKWRSNLIFSAFNADNDTSLTGTGVTKKSMSTRINLVYQLFPSMMIGGEYAFAKREIESGADGNMNRLQFSVKYSF